MIVIIAIIYLVLVTTTAYLLLTVSWFYTFWAYGLSAVASYLLTDYIQHTFFDKIRRAFTNKLRVLKPISYIEMIFLTAILASLLNYSFQTSLQARIDLVLTIGYPLLILLGIIYYSKVYSKTDTLSNTTTQR